MDFFIRSGLANRTFSHMDTDSPDVKGFKKNYPHEISYQFNSLGCRCDELSTDEEMPIVFFGCSQTVGVGVPLENTWPFLVHSFVANKLKSYLRPPIRYINLATGGGSNDTIAQNVVAYLERYNPRIICVMMTDKSRRCLWLEAQKESVNFLLNKAPYGDAGEWKAFSTLSSFDENNERNFRANLELINLACAAKQVEWVWSGWFHRDEYAVHLDRFINPRMNIIDHGRDDHPGVDSHEQEAEKWMNHPRFQYAILNAFGASL